MEIVNDNHEKIYIQNLDIDFGMTMGLDKFEGKDEKKEKKEEKKELTWDNEADRTILATALNMLGFKQTEKRSDLFVKQISKDEAIFVDFSKNPKGVFYPKKGSKLKVEERVEYKAFRAMQKGQAKANPENPKEITIVDDEGREQVLLIPDYVEGEEVVKVSPQDFFIEWEGKKYYIKPEFIEVIKNRPAPNIKGIIDVVQRANAIRDWKTEILKEPEKILPKQVDDPRDPEHYDEPADIHSKDYLCIAKTTVVRADGKTFTAHGSAHPLSVSGNLRPKIIEMAETRSLARALRFAFNIHAVTAEEIEDVMEEKEG